jgi:hypothetical protein
MRKGATHIRFLDPAGRNQVVYDPQVKLALDENCAFQQQVSMFGDGSGQCVLDGNDRDLRFTFVESVENFPRSRTGNQARPRHHA